MIADTEITKLDFLALLKNLEIIDISGTKISDISIFSQLSKLRNIQASDTLIKDLKPLKDLTQLEVLTMERAKISSVKPLEKIHSLKAIDLYGNSELTDITSLSFLENLTALTVKGTGIVYPDDLSCLEKLSFLEKLIVNVDIEFAAKSVLHTIAKISTGKKTSFSEKQEVILQFPQPNTNQSLDLSCSDISDISFLLNYPDLVELNLTSTGITDIGTEIISKLTKLRTLKIEDTAITNLEFLEPLSNLEIINISGTKISDILVFSELPKLKEIYAHDTFVSNLWPLENLIHLRVLKMERAAVVSVEALSKIQSLEVIDLYGNFRLTDIKPLGNLKNLKDLCIKNTNVNRPEQLNYLETLIRLEELTVNLDIEFAVKHVLEAVKENRKKSLTDFFSHSEKNSALKKEENLNSHEAEKEPKSEVNLQL